MGDDDRSADEPARARRALAEVEIRRDDLYTAVLGLERAMATASGDDVPAWAARAEVAALALRATWRRHVTGTEAATGIFATVADESPRSIPAAERLRAEHPGLGHQIDALVEALAGTRDRAAVAGVREQALDLLRALLAHRHRGAELVYDAFQVDIEAGD